MPWPSLLAGASWLAPALLVGLGLRLGAAWAPRECLAWALAHLLVPAAALLLFFLLHQANPISA